MIQCELRINRLRQGVLPEKKNIVPKVPRNIEKQRDEIVILVIYSWESRINKALLSDY